MASAFDPDSDPRGAIFAESFEQRVRQHRGALRACAQRLLGDDVEADAVVAEVLASAPRALALFRPAGSLGCWLQGMTVGAALARLEARGARDRAASHGEPPPRQIPARAAAAG
jgi:DNA-directed RNA polymerase specialized sigma24 family protein